MSEQSAIDWMSAVENQSTVRLLEEEVNPKYIEEKLDLIREEPVDPTTVEALPEELQPKTIKKKKVKTQLKR